MTHEWAGGLTPEREARRALFLVDRANLGRQAVRELEEFGLGNEGAVKITYWSDDSGQRPEELLQRFRNAYNPRIAVTVDLIATGTDVKPIECVVFMRRVRSRNYFEQMKGRGVRVIAPYDFRNPPFSTHGGYGRALQLFGDELSPLLDELMEELVA